MLLLVQRIGVPNAGVTIDTGHSLFACEEVAEAAVKLFSIYGYKLFPLKEPATPGIRQSCGQVVPSTQGYDRGLSHIAVAVGDASEDDDLAFLGSFGQNGPHQTQPFRVCVA